MRRYPHKLGAALLILATSPANSQRMQEEVPLMRPDEKKVVDAQSIEFNESLEPLVAESAK